MTQVQEDAAAVAAVLRQGWTQYVYARNAGGDRVWPNDPDAVCHCALGAVSSVCGPLINDRSHALVRIATQKVSPYRSFTQFNDTPGRIAEEVIAVFDAIAAGEPVP